MVEARTHALDELIDGQRIRAFNVNLLFWSFMVMLIDGYDLFAVAFSAPAIIADWHIEKAAFAPVFSASLIGILVGAPVFGWVGDRFGRRKALILGCLICGIFSLWCAGAQSIAELWWLRFATGIGLGGIMPNAISLNAEMAPKRVRAPMIILMFAGINVGGAIPGAVAAWVVPHHGWQVLYLIGGVAPIVIAILVAIAMPESAKFFALHPRNATRLAVLVRRMRPDLNFTADDSFVLPKSTPSDKSSVSVKHLFSDGLAPITLLLWSLFALNLMTSYLLTSWMPILFESNGVSPASAALANAMYQIGGVIGGLIVSLMLARFGFAVIAVLFSLAFPAVAAIGWPGMSNAGIVTVVTAAGFCNLGLQFGLNASAGLLYPTGVRAKGVGMAFAMGRLGSILGPFLGAALIQSGVGLTWLFVVAAAPLLLGLLAAAIMAQLCAQRFGGTRLEADGPKGGLSAVIEVGGH